MTSISKLVHINKLSELVEEYSYTIHVPIIDVKTDTCIDIENWYMLDLIKKA